MRRRWWNLLEKARLPERDWTCFGRNPFRRPARFDRWTMFCSRLTMPTAAPRPGSEYIARRSTTCFVASAWLCPPRWTQAERAGRTRRPRKERWPEEMASVVLVTGSAGGIGRAVVGAFAEIGWMVLATDRRPETAPSRASRFFPSAVSRQEAVQAPFQKVRAE